MVDQREEILSTNRPLVEPADQRPQRSAGSARLAGAGLGRAPCEDGMVVGRAGGVGEAAAEHELRNELVEMTLPSAHSQHAQTEAGAVGRWKGRTPLAWASAESKKILK